MASAADYIIVILDLCFESCQRQKYQLLLLPKQALVIMSAVCLENTVGGGGGRRN